MFIIPSVGNMIRRDAFWAHVVPTGIVFVVLIVFTFIGWQSTKNTYDAQRQSVILERISQIEDAIGRRMQSTETLLRAGAGLFDSSDTINRAEWSRFYKQFNIPETLDGVRSIGYAPVVPAGSKTAFENTLQAGNSQARTIQPSGSRKLYVPVQFVERFDPGTVDNSGNDLYAEPEIRTTIDSARDKGSVRMSSIVKLGEPDRLRVFLFKAVYTQGASVETQRERRAALQGYVFAVLYTSELFSGLSTRGNEHFTFAVAEHDGNTPRQIYTDGNFPLGAEQVETTSSELYGQSWDISYYASGDIVSPAESARPATVLVTGLLLALLVSLAVYLLIKYRTRMFALAEEQKLQEAKDELLSLASHQLRTPATGVKQYIGMVIDGFAGALSKDQAKLLEQAYKSNERQLQIINEFLYVAKLGSGSLTTTRHVFDLASLVRDVADEMEMEIEERQHTIQVSVPKTLQVKADEHSVRMIVENLLSNAVKYTQPGGRIAVKIEQSLREARVSIADTGVGISKRQQKQLFKQFSRISNELSKEVSGSGIGLYLAQQLAERNGGSITVESERGKGSTFTLHLPIRLVKKITNIRH